VNILDGAVDKFFGVLAVVIVGDVLVVVVKVFDGAEGELNNVLVRFGVVNLTVVVGVSRKVAVLIVDIVDVIFALEVVDGV
jgi:hypothetical protein